MNKIKKLFVNGMPITDEHQAIKIIKKTANKKVKSAYDETDEALYIDVDKKEI